MQRSYSRILYLLGSTGAGHYSKTVCSCRIKSLVLRLSASMQNNLPDMNSRRDPLSSIRCAHEKCKTIHTNKEERNVLVSTNNN